MGATATFDGGARLEGNSAYNGGGVFALYHSTFILNSSAVVASNSAIVNGGGASLSSQSSLSIRSSEVKEHLYFKKSFF